MTRRQLTYTILGLGLLALALSAVGAAQDGLSASSLLGLVSLLAVLFLTVRWSRMTLTEEQERRSARAGTLALALVVPTLAIGIGAFYFLTSKEPDCRGSASYGVDDAGRSSIRCD